MQKKFVIVSVFLIFLLICIVAGVSFDRNIGVALESELGNQCAYIINDAVNYALSENLEIADLPTVEKNGEGAISYVSVNSLILNRFSMDVMKILEDEVRGLDNLKISIPVGNIISSRIFSGKGPSLDFEAYPAGGIDLDFEPCIMNGGVNQVLFHMDLKVMVEIETVFGFREFRNGIERSVPVCDIIIVGNVPQTYANLPSDTDFLNLLP